MGDQCCGPEWLACFALCMQIWKFGVVKFLLENSTVKGIDIYKKSNNQTTAQALAKEEGHYNILGMLNAWTLAETVEESTFALLRLTGLNFVFSHLLRLYRW